MRAAYRRLQEGSDARRRRRRQLRPQPECGFHRQPHPPRPMIRPTAHTPQQPSAENASTAALTGPCRRCTARHATPLLQRASSSSQRQEDATPINGAIHLPLLQARASKKQQSWACHCTWTASTRSTTYAAIPSVATDATAAYTPLHHPNSFRPAATPPPCTSRAAWHRRQQPVTRP